MKLNIKAALKHLRSRLAHTSQTAALDAQVLLGHILGRSRSWVMAHPEYDLLPEQASKLAQAAVRLEDGEPLPYILGHWEFFGLDFEVSPAVLIPRPETELVVEEALHWLSANPQRRRAVDVGTGSGCIAISLASRLEDLHITATDLSASALRVARRNALKHNVAARVNFVQGDLLAAIQPPLAALFDLICANLPYLSAHSQDRLDALRWEPQHALVGGEDGLLYINKLVAEAPSRLAPGGLLLLEIDAHLSMAARWIVQTALPEARVRVLRDLSRLDRLLVAQV